MKWYQAPRNMYEGKARRALTVEGERDGMVAAVRLLTERIEELDMELEAAYAEGCDMTVEEYRAAHREAAH
jgi:hypothetical protein